MSSIQRYTVTKKNTAHTFLSRMIKRDTKGTEGNSGGSIQTFTRRNSDKA